jgi:hypothetical protein
MTNDTDGGARNHHFVPQFYLKGFAKPRSKDGKLIVFDLKNRKTFVTRTRNVAAKRDYNRVDIKVRIRTQWRAICPSSKVMRIRPSGASSARAL